MTKLEIPPPKDWKRNLRLQQPPRQSPRLGSVGEMCVCEVKGERCGWGSCDPTAPRPASQAGETQEAWREMSLNATPVSLRQPSVPIS